MKSITTYQKTASNASSNQSAGLGGISIAPPNHTGLPDVLKSGVESLSGFSLDDVRVHYNSPRPAQLQALAYTQGTEIHVGPGQERHLPHEAWHVVQQKQGRVESTFQMKGIPVNDDVRLESEADAMGRKAIQMKAGKNSKITAQKKQDAETSPIQMKSQIVKLERTTDDMIGTVDDDLMIRLLEADEVVEANAKRLAKRTGAGIEGLSPPDQEFPADWIRDVTDLYIVGHGSKGKVAGLTPRKLAGNLYPAIYEEVKKIHPDDQDARYAELGKRVKIQSIDIVACHSAEDYINPETQQTSSFAKDFYGFVSNLNRDLARSISVSGVNGYAIVDYEGDVRAISEDSIDEYRKEKEGLKSVKSRSKVLDKYAQSGKGINKFIYAPETKQTSEISTGKVVNRGSCFITTACVRARGLPDDCLELTTLRAFRDQYIATLENGKAMIKLYYENSPAIVEAIDQRQDAREIYDDLYDIIRLCACYVEEEAYERAFQTYIDMVIKLRNRFTPMVKIPAYFYRNRKP